MNKSGLKNGNTGISLTIGLINKDVVVKWINRTKLTPRNGN